MHKFNVICLPGVTVILKFASFPDGTKGQGYTVNFAVSLCGPVNKFGNTVTLQIAQGLSMSPRLQNRESFCNSRSNRGLTSALCMWCGCTTFVVTTNLVIYHHRATYLGGCNASYHIRTSHGRLR